MGDAGGLTLAKLRAARRIMVQAEVEAEEPGYIGITINGEFRVFKISEAIEEERAAVAALLAR